MIGDFQCQSIQRSRTLRETELIEDSSGSSARARIRAFRERSHAQSGCPAGGGKQSESRQDGRGQFRSDLYYRLNVFPVLLPALRERREDIPALVTHFVNLFSRRMGKQVDSIPPETMAAFQLYSWPGNIRELQNLVERAVILSREGVLQNPLHKKTEV